MSASPALGRREATKQANKAAIVEAAKDVFADLGYGAASVRDIVRRTGLATGTFYNYFPDKEAVFREIVDEFADEARIRVHEARARATDVRSFVEDSYRAYFEWIVEDPGVFAVMRRNTGTVRAMFDDVQLPATTDELARDLRAGIAAGQIPPVDVEYCAHTMIAVGVELGVRLIEREPPDVEGAVQFATGLFLGGLDRLAS